MHQVKLSNFQDPKLKKNKISYKIKFCFQIQLFSIEQIIIKLYMGNLKFSINYRFIKKTMTSFKMQNVPQIRKTNQIKRSLRSINNCFRVPNLFLNKNQDFLTENIDFIPKHVRRKIIDKQYLNCKDILDLNFSSQRPKVDVITVKTAVKIQQNYKNLILQLDQKEVRKEKLEKLMPKTTQEMKIEPRLEEISIYRRSLHQKMEQQYVKHEIPTEKELKAQINS